MRPVSLGGRDLMTQIAAAAVVAVPAHCIDGSAHAVGDTLGVTHLEGDVPTEECGHDRLDTGVRNHETLDILDVPDEKHLRFDALNERDASDSVKAHRAMAGNTDGGGGTDAILVAELLGAHELELLDGMLEGQRTG